MNKRGLRHPGISTVHLGFSIVVQFSLMVQTPVLPETVHGNICQTKELDLENNNAKCTQPFPLSLDTVVSDTCREVPREYEGLPKQ